MYVICGRPAAHQTHDHLMIDMSNYAATVDGVFLLITVHDDGGLDEYISAFQQGAKEAECVNLIIK